MRRTHRHVAGWPRAWALLVLGLLLSALAGPVPAAAPIAPAPPLRDYAIDLWTSREGLPHNSIRDIAQTPDGYLWFGTWEGLTRYNGLDFTTFDRGTRPALADNGIGALYVAPDGALWLSDSRGNISRYGSDGTFKIWPRPADAPEVLLPAMTMDRHGRLWMLFEGRGLACLEPDGRYRYETPGPDSPLRTAYAHLAIDAQDRVLVGSTEGLLRRDQDGTLHNVSREAGLPAGAAWPYLAPDGALWVVAQDHLYRMEGQRLVLRHVLPRVGRPSSMVQDRRGELWLGTESGEVLRIGRNGVETLTSAWPLPGGRITSLKEDAEGSLWIGANGGLFRLHETLFSNITKRHGLDSDYVRALLEDGEGAMWVGHPLGLQRIEADRRVTSVVLPTQTGKPPSVLSLARQRDGTLWVGTASDGVYRVPVHGAIARYGTEQGVPQGTVRAISVGADDVVWLATQRGLAYIDGARAVRPQVAGLPSGLITAVHSEPGAVWMGTLEGALVLRGTQVRALPVGAMGGARTVFGFTRLGDAMWIATDRGLYRERNGALARVGREQGVPVDTVFELKPDHAGRLWITSNRGVLYTSLASLDRVADGLQPRVLMTSFNEMDGMANSQANGSSGPTEVVRGDGTVWIATAGGVSIVDPARMQWFRDRPAPPVVIDDVQRDGAPLAWRTERPLRLNGDQRLTVSYVGLSYLMPERTEYRTRLEGLDSDWVRRGHQRSIELARLPPGDYTLRVSAAHPDGAWSDPPAVLRFTVDPLLWQRHDVQFAATALLVLALFGLYRYRMHRYRHRTARLAGLVDARTRDLQAQAQRLRQADEEKTDLLQQMRVQAEAFERQAREDMLTGLPNRRAFEERLAQEMARARRSGQPLCLAMLDVDHFKRVNDQHSHTVGDAVLREVGRLLAAQQREADMAARSGGEEFCLLFTDTTLEQAARACERLRGLFHARRDWGGVAGLAITFSAGLVMLEPGDAAPAALYQRADRLLYRAKRNGRDRIEHD